MNTARGMVLLAVGATGRFSFATWPSRRAPQPLTLSSGMFNHSTGRTMKKAIIISTALIVLSACASQPPKTLDQKLAETTSAADRKETLRLACLNEAEWPASLQKVRTTGRHGIQQRQRLKRTPEITEMKLLCRQMDDLTTADAEEKLPPKELATACASKVAAKKQKEGKGWAEHADRISHICKEMTGKKL